MGTLSGFGEERVCRMEGEFSEMLPKCLMWIFIQFEIFSPPTQLGWESKNYFFLAQWTLKMESLCKAMTDISVNRLSTIALWLFQLWHFFAFRIALAGMFRDKVVLSSQCSVSSSKGSKASREGTNVRSCSSATRYHSILFLVTYSHPLIIAACL